MCFLGRAHIKYDLRVETELIVCAVNKFGIAGKHDSRTRLKIQLSNRIPISNAFFRLEKRFRIEPGRFERSAKN